MEDAPLEDGDAAADALAMVQEITGAETNRARELLENCNGSAEEAIALHFASEDHSPRTQDTAATGWTQEPHAGWAHDQDFGWSAVNRVPMPMAEITPLASPGATSSTAPVPIAPTVQPYTPPGGLFEFLKRKLYAITQTVTGISNEDYREWFMTHYGTPCPEFSTADYSTTMENARRNNKLVILLLHKAAFGTTDNDSCCRAFQHEAVLNALNDNFLLFACDASRFDSAHIAAKLNIRIFPTLVIVKPLGGFSEDPSVLEWPFGVFCKPLGRVTPVNFSPDDVMLFLLQMVDETQSAEDQREMANNARQRQNDEARRIREMQDREYEEGLLRDQLRAIESTESNIREAMAPPPTAVPTPAAPASTPITVSGVQSAARTPPNIPGSALSSPEARSGANTPPPPPPKEETPSWRRARREVAKDFLQLPTAADDVKKTKISLRFPSGYKCDKILAADTKAKLLYVWAETIEEQVAISGKEEELVPRVPEKISLWMSFPPTEIPNSEESLESLGLCPATALLVRFHKNE